MIVKRSSDNIEKESLAAHVELCSQRYSTLEKKLEELESDLHTLNKTIAFSKTTMLKAISVGVVVLTSSISVLIIILDRIQ